MANGWKRCPTWFIGFIVSRWRSVRGADEPRNPASGLRMYRPHRSPSKRIEPDGEPV
jgi:hypothetical protein